MRLEDIMTKTRAGWAGLALGLARDLWALRRAAGTARCSRVSRRSRCSRRTTSASSATRWPSGCSTTAGSRRCSRRGFPKHELVVRNLGFSGDEIDTRLRSKNFGTPDEWLSGLAKPIGGYEDNRFAGTEHQGRRRVRVLRLQRVATPARRGSRRSRRSWATGSRTRSRRNTTDDRRRASCSSPPSRTRTSAIPICPTARRTTSAWRSTPRRWRRSRKPGNVTFVDLFTPSAKLYAEIKAPLTMQGIHLNSEGNRQIAQVIDRALFGDSPKLPGSAAHEAAAGGRRQGPALVPALSRDRRLRDLRRPGVPDLRARQPAKRQRGSGRKGRQGRHPAHQLRSAAARDHRARRDDPQPRPAHLGGRARRATSRSTTPTRRRSSTRRPTSPARGPAARTCSSTATRPSRR